MYYINRISSPLSESWVFIVYTILLLFVYLASKISPGMISVSFKTLFSNKERDNMFFDLSPNFRSQFLIDSFIIGIIALNLQLFSYRNGQFSVIDYVQICVLVIAYFLVKLLIIRILCSTFWGKNVFSLITIHYQRILISTSVLLIPTTLLAIYFSQNYPIFVNATYIIILIFYLLTLIIKIIRLFFNKILASFYIFLYLCTLEILPFFALLDVAKKILQ